MKSDVQDISGIRKISFSPFRDFRGELLKLYRREIFTDLLPTVEEMYLSRSSKNTVRGLHFQLGNKGQDKFIYCISGRLLDISVDLRADGEFGNVQVHELAGGSDIAVLIPGSFAHGIIALEDNTTFLNITPQRYSPGDERGVRWDSLGIDFNLSDPIVTEKDKNWPTLAEVMEQVRHP